MEPLNHPRRAGATLLGLAGLALVACGAPRDDGGTGLSSAPLCSAVQLASSSPGPMPPASTVLLTASGAACAPGETPEYRFLHQRVGAPVAPVEFRGWGSGPTATFANAGLPPGQYVLQVLVRRAGSAAPAEAMAYVVISSGSVCPVAALSASPGGPQPPGTTVTLTASNGCPGAAQYAFYVRWPGELGPRLLRGFGGAAYAWGTAGLGPGTYELLVVARDPVNPASQSVASLAYALGAANRPPIITSDGGGDVAGVSVQENAPPLVTTVVATDPDPGTTLAYTLSGGADAAAFTLAPSGALAFGGGPRDFEQPADADGDNVYEVVVRASDGALSDTQLVRVTVLDVPEGDTTASTPILTPALPAVRDGNENDDIPLGLHAELTDTDGSESLTVTITAQFGDPLPGAAITDGAHLHTFGADPAEVVDVSGWNVDAIAARQAHDVDADLLFLVTARATEQDGGATAEVSTWVTARFYTQGTGAGSRVTVDLQCQVAPGLCLGGPIVDVNGDGFLDHTDFGRALGGGGDFDGDGFADLAVGAFGASPGGPGALHAGAAYVVLGGPGGLGGNAGEPDVNGTNGLRLEGALALDNLGRAVDLSGDLDGDGYDELLVKGAGTLHVLYGRPGPYAASLPASSAVELYRGFGAGAQLATADLNGDGLDDLVEGWIDPASGRSAPGAHVVYGSTTRLAGPIDWGAIDGASQSILFDPGAGILFGGSAVAGAGDVNGDGFDDLAIGVAPQGEYGPGSVHVVFGSAAGPGAAFDLSTELDGTSGFTVTSSDPLENLGLGFAVGGAGDVNGDGFDDVVVGAPHAVAQLDPHAGVSWVILGHAGAFPQSIDLAQLAPGEGFRVEGAEAYDGAGYAVGAAGDVNGDGLDDVVIGALRAAPPGYRVMISSGESYVLFGAEAPGPVVDLASLPADVATRLEGGYSIVAVGAAGDADGDGRGEVAIGAPDVGGLGAPSANGMVFRLGGDTLGGPQPRGVIQGTSGDDLVDFGSTLPELVQGLEGDDDLDGGGGDDVVLGGAGDDRIVYHPGARRLSGGSGFDTLAVSGSLDLTDPVVTRRRHLLEGFERIELYDSLPSVLTVDLASVVRLSPARAGGMVQANVLVVLGDPDDLVHTGPGWTFAGTTQHGGLTLEAYAAARGNARLWIQQGVGVAF